MATEATNDTKRDTKGLAISRREFLAGAAATAGSAALPAGLRAQIPKPPTNVHLKASKSVLAATDFAYLGMFSVSNGVWTDAIRWGYEVGGLTGRRVDRGVRLLCLSGASPPPESNFVPHVYEITPPSSFGRNRATAPWAGSFVRDWGPVGSVRVSDPNGATVRGICWDPGINGVWWAYAPYYSGRWHDPGLGYLVLDDGNGTSRSFGPWRTQAFGKYSGGYMCSIPQWFADSYCKGYGIALGSAILPRNATSAWGPMFLPAARLSDFTTRAADVIQASETDAINGPDGPHPRWSIPTLNGLLHTYQHKYVRTTFRDEVIHCGWGPTEADCGPPYESQRGRHTTEWAVFDPTMTMTSLDWWASSAWIDTGTKHGLCFFATLVRNTGIHDGKAHLWYGTATCPHGHYDRRHDPNTPGDGSSCKAPVLHIFDPAKVGEALRGVRSPWDVPCVEYPLYGTLFAESRFQDAMQDDLIIGAWFDEVDRRLYVRERFGDTRIVGYDSEPRSMIHVFEVR